MSIRRCSSAPTRDGVAWDELARRETDQFVQDCRDLHMIAPTFFPKASEEIEAMLPIVARLIEQGHAYAGGSVYFSVQTSRLWRDGAAGLRSGC